MASESPEYLWFWSPEHSPCVLGWVFLRSHQLRAESGLGRMGTLPLVPVTLSPALLPWSQKLQNRPNLQTEVRDRGDGIGSRPRPAQVAFSL